ncbi:MAG: hypothetical protein ABSA75_11870 [Candidatus Bathyarchaeia archaeon]
MGEAEKQFSELPHEEKHQIFNVIASAGEENEMEKTTINGVKQQKKRNDKKDSHSNTEALEHESNSLKRFPKRK